MGSSVESVWLMGRARYGCLPNITRVSGKSRQRFSSDEIRMRHRSGDDLVRVLFEEATKAGTRPSPLLSHARSEEHTSELQSRGLTSYAVFCLKKKKTQ